MGKKFFLLFLVIFVFLTPLVAENSPYPLKEWEFFWEDFITFGSTENPDGTISIPQSWEKITKQITGKSTNKGYCSYRKVLSNLDPNKEYAILINESPASACTLFINGEEYYSVGTVSTSKETYKPYISPIYVYFNADQEGKAEIIFHISNFEQKKGGFSTSVFFGNKTEIFKYYIMQNGVSWLVVGTLVILSCFNILLFLLSRERKANLYFALLIFIISLRLGVSRFSIFSLSFPSLSYQFLLKIEYLSIWLAPILLTFIILIKSKDTIKNHIITKCSIIGFFALGLFITVTPISISNILLPVIEVFAYFTIFLSIFYLITQLKNKDLLVTLNLFSIAILAIVLGLDLFIVIKNPKTPFNFFPLCFLLFAVFQFLSLAAQYRILHNTQKKLVKNLKSLNDMCLRFVPKEFLKQIEKDSINKVHLGDCSEKNMTISCTSLDFSNTLETDLSAEQEYSLFSNCISLIFPIIKKHNGYIAKIENKEIFCLFAKHPSDAVYCNFEVTQTLADYMNQERNISFQLKKSTGIHYGKVLLGTIGEENRLEDTVISESVNLVHRISAIARKMNIDFIFSDTFYELVSENKFDFAHLGTTAVKGKSQPITIYTCSKQKESPKLSYNSEINSKKGEVNE